MQSGFEFTLAKQIIFCVACSYMTNKIFGLDPTKPITSLHARDALMECFYQAHCISTELDGVNKETNREYCNSLVKKSFAETGGNFESPTKEEIISVMDRLAQMSRNFRSQDVIQKHYNTIMSLVNKL